MPQANGVYNISKGGSVQWASGGDDIRVLLYDDTYIFNPDHDYLRDITNSGSEASGTGYARRKTYNRTVSVDNTSDELQHDVNDTVWTSIDAGTIGGAVYYINNASESQAQLICSTKLSSTVVTNGGDFTLVVDAEGAYKGIPD